MSREYAIHEAFLATREGDLCAQCGHQFACPSHPCGAPRSGYDLAICVACSYTKRTKLPLRLRAAQRAGQELAAINAMRQATATAGN
jgi:hypothetical protein